MWTNLKWLFETVVARLTKVVVRVSLPGVSVLAGIVLLFDY